MIGIALFLYLPRKEDVLPWQIYTIVRGLVFSLRVMPTFFVAGHGGMITNTIAGAMTVIVLGGSDVGLHGLLFGKAGGPAIYLEPCILALGGYVVIFVLDAIIHSRNVD